MAAGRFDRDCLIRHNLDRFLEPAPGPLTAWQRLLWSEPFLPPAIAFIVGICAQHVLNLSHWTGAAAAGFAAVLFSSGLWARKHPTRRFVFCWLSVVFLFTACGMLRYAAFASPGPDHIIRLVGHERRLATLEGVIVSPVHHDQQNDWTFAPYFPRPAQSSFYLSVAALKTADGPIAASGLVRVQVAELAEHVQRDDRVRLYSWLGPFGPPDNPGQFDMHAYMRRRGVLLGASVPAADAVEILEPSQDRPFSLRAVLQGYASGALFEEANFSDQSGALAAALLLGQRGDLPAETYAAFQRTGLAHFVSLSGMHVGILAGSLWALSRFLGLAKPLRAVLCMALLIGYGLVVPPRPPTVRALFLACFFLTSVAINRRIRPLNTLALSAIVLLIVRPADLFSASWQLSFSTVLGILLLYDPLSKTLHAWTVFKGVEWPSDQTLERPAVQFALRFAYKGVQLLAVGLAAWLGGAGFLLYHFNSITPLAALWTVLAMPLVLGILYAGYLKIALAPIFPTLSLLLAVGMDYCCRGLTSVVSLFSTVRWSEILIGAAPVWGIVLGYMLLYGVRFLPRRMAIRVVALALLLPVGLGWTHLRNSGKTLTMTCLSVGHGLAVRVSFPDNTHWLIDAGSISHKDPGTRAVVPYLRSRGIGALDAVLLTHADLDHYNGLPEVVARKAAPGVFANASVFEKAQSSAPTAFFKQVLRQNGNALRLVEELELPAGDVDIRMLWPDEQTARNAALSDNDRSQVIWLDYGGRRVLLCGDIELYAQEKILEKYPTLKADVIVLPHHGSMTTLQEHFVTAFEPAIVIASCAAGRVNNAFTPAADSGIEAFYTPIDGAVTITVKADGALHAVGFKSQKAVYLP